MLDLVANQYTIDLGLSSQMGISTV